MESDRARQRDGEERRQEKRRERESAKKKKHDRRVDEINKRNQGILFI